MITIDRRRAIRGAYWAILAAFAVSLFAPFLLEQLPNYVAVERAVLEPLAQRLAASPNVYLGLMLLTWLVGYFWPRDVGHATGDTLGRAVLLAVVAGLMALGLSHYYIPELDFWTGFRAGFLFAALTPPPAEARRPR